jgi:hypothetical protein
VDRVSSFPFFVDQNLGQLEDDLVLLRVDLLSENSLLVQGREY